MQRPKHGLGGHVTILGFEIDNKLENLDTNFSKVKEKIKALIRKWKPYHLSLGAATRSIQY